MANTQKLGNLVNGLFVDASGNVAINDSTSSGYRLKVNGTLGVTGAATFSSSVTATNGIFTDGTQGLNVRSYTGGAGFGAIYSTGVTAGAGNFALAASSTATILSGVDNVSMAINSATKLYINSSGNVGIGTTSPTARPLTIYGTSDTNRGISFRGGNSAGGNIMLEGYDTDDNEYSNFEFVANSGGGYFVFNSGAGTNPNSWTTNAKMVIGTNGRVGIGATDPKCRLQVSNISSSGSLPALGSIGTGTSLYLTNNNYGYGMLMGMLPTGNGWIQVQRTDSNATAYDLVLQPNGGSVAVTGSLSKGSGSFKIDHPIESMSDTHNLVHSFVESPQANNIYRGKIQLINGKAEVNLDEVSTMTEGTFVLLNREIHTYTSNETDWDSVRGKVDENILTIECQNNQSNAIVSWLVIGERQDKHMMDTDWTDENGKVIVEPLKQS